MIAAIVVVSLLLIGAFVAVAVAGNKAQTRLVAEQADRQGRDGGSTEQP